jgi:hypothetical protein
VDDEDGKAKGAKEKEEIKTSIDAFSRSTLGLQRYVQELHQQASS